MASTLTAAGPMTTTAHWDEAYSDLPSARFWSPVDPTFSDILRLLAKYVRPGSRHLEIGCAPGKYLAAANLKLGARVSGIDYSPQGFGTARRYFSKIGVQADLRLEDAFETSFRADTFDTVFSAGLIEHFDDPRSIVAKHIELVKPGGTVIIVIPNYGGVLGRIQDRLDPENIAIHNLSIMSPEALGRLFPGPVETRYFGRFNLWGLSLAKAIPLASSVQRAAGLAGSVLPQIPGLAPHLVAIATKPAHDVNPASPGPIRNKR